MNMKKNPHFSDDEWNIIFHLQSIVYKKNEKVVMQSINEIWIDVLTEGVLKQ